MGSANKRLKKRHGVSKKGMKKRSNTDPEEIALLKGRGGKKPAKQPKKRDGLTRRSNFQGRGKKGGKKHSKQDGRKTLKTEKHDEGKAVALRFSTERVEVMGTKSDGSYTDDITARGKTERSGKPTANCAKRRFSKTMIKKAWGRGSPAKCSGCKNRTMEGGSTTGK